MRSGAWHWFAVRSAFLILLITGCDLTPDRGKLDPGLYPIPVRPRSNYLDQPTSRADKSHSEASLASEAQAIRQLVAGIAPPDLQPISVAEALNSAPTSPTPMLDDATVLAQAVREATLTPPDAPGLNPEDDADGLKENGGGAALPESATAVTEVPKLPEPAPEDSSISTDTDLLPPPRHQLNKANELVATNVDDVREFKSDSAIGLTPISDSDQPEFQPLPTSTTLDIDESVANSVEEPTITDSVLDPDDYWRVGLENLLSLTESESHRDGETSEVWAARRRVLDLLTEAEGDLDRAELGQIVVRMLAEPVGQTGARDRASGPTTVAEKPLQITDLQLCREVVRFGEFDPIDRSDCQAGQDVILYAETDGVHYEKTSDTFSSQVVTVVEITSDQNDVPIWLDLRAAEDSFHRPRRDYFAAYLLTLPSTLEPGNYQLRVAQRDLLTDQQAVGAIRFTISSRGQ